MDWSRKIVFDNVFAISWRLALILLPWQTRWFREGPFLGGWPWEAGRWSVYLSWLPILIVIAMNARWLWTRGKQRPGIAVLIGFLSAFVFFTIFFSVYRPAAIQWWVEGFFLGVFSVVLMARVAREKLIAWIVYAIFPHALLGVLQSIVQFVHPSKWLGIALQDPLVPGVSVIETEGRRWLRAYGGFPHPNILGGWLVLGVGAVLSGIEYRVLRVSIFWHLGLALMSFCLVLTFSRSAWLAFVVLLMMQAIRVFRYQKECFPSFLRGLLVVLVAVSVVVIWRWPLLVTRTSSATRLEQRSLDERAVGWKYGIQLFQHHPWFGIGPRGMGFALIQENIAPSNQPPVLPHNVPLLILNELGVIGGLIFCFFIFLILRIFHPRFFVFGSYLLPFLVISLFDHYLWSTWSGLSLAVLIFILSFFRSYAATS